MKQIIQAVLESGGFPSTEPLDSVMRIANSRELDTLPASEVCAYSWALASFGEWDRAEAVAHLITNDQNERGQALAILAQRLVEADLLDRADQVAKSIVIAPELTGALVEKATALIAIASRFAQAHQSDRAIQLLTQAELTTKQRVRADHLQASLLADIAQTWMSLGRLEEALKLWDEAVYIARESIRAYRTGGQPDVDSWKSLAIIAEDLFAIGENERAERAIALIDNDEWREKVLIKIRNRLKTRQIDGFNQ